MLQKVFDVAIERSKEPTENSVHGDKDRRIFDPNSGKYRHQPRPKVPLLSGGDDPKLGEPFEEELYRSQRLALSLDSGGLIVALDPDQNDHEAFAQALASGSARNLRLS